MNKFSSSRRNSLFSLVLICFTNMVNPIGRIQNIKLFQLFLKYTNRMSIGYSPSNQKYKKKIVHQMHFASLHSPAKLFKYYIFRSKDIFSLNFLTQNLYIRQWSRGLHKKIDEHRISIPQNQRQWVLHILQWNITLFSIILSRINGLLRDSIDQKCFGNENL